MMMAAETGMLIETAMMMAADPACLVQVQEGVLDIAPSEESKVQEEVLVDLAPSEASEEVVVLEGDLTAMLAEQAEKADPATSVPQRLFTVHDTLLIFDWDDTLLPTTWIRMHGLDIPGASLEDWHQEILLAVAQTAAYLLQAAQQLGTVAIVTNAEAGWVETSCCKFLPQLCPLLLDGVHLVSARSSYEPHGISCPFEWKHRAFDAHIRNHYGFSRDDEPRNVVSIGDSCCERDALIRVAQCLPNCPAKTVKFVECPDPSQLLEEQRLIAEGLDTIVQHSGAVSICMNANN